MDSNLTSFFVGMNAVSTGKARTLAGHQPMPLPIVHYPDVLHGLNSRRLAQLSADFVLEAS